MGIRPGVHAALPFALAMGDTFANMRQVLKDDGAPRGSVLHDAFGEDMVMVSSLPKQFARKLFQVPFGRFASLFLKLATETEDAAFLLFPTTVPQEWRMVVTAG